MAFPEYMQNQANAHHEIIAILERLGPGMTSLVTVNGRRMHGDAAVKLIESLPAAASVWQQNRVITIEPDPFTLPFARATTDTVGLVARLLERQDAADRTRSWWQRLERHKSRVSLG